MQHSTPTTKGSRRRRIAVVVIAVLALGSAVAWKFGFALLGMTAPGQCTIATSGGTTVVSHDEALAMFNEARANKESFSRAAISCSYEPRFGSGDLTLNDRGLTASAQVMDDAVRAEFGRIPDGGYEPGGVTTGHIAGSAHYEGRAIDYFFRPYTKPKNRLAGWQLAQWAVLHADELDISTIIFDDMIWYRNTSARGWQQYTHPSGDTENPIRRHLDHVHLDVR